MILTLRSADHGCDVVVLGHDRAENRLVQCKHTTARVFEGGRPVQQAHADFVIEISAPVA